MNYRVFSDTKSPRLLNSYDAPIWEKPNVGDIIRLPNDRTLYVITKQNRNTNTPEIQQFEKLITQDSKTLTTQDGLVLIVNEKINFEHLDVSYDFFITQRNRSPDSISLRYDSDQIQRKMQRFG